MQQLHYRVVFKPISVNKSTKLERKRAMVILVFLDKNRNKTIKSRMCVNESTQWTYISSEEATRPTAASEAIITTGVINV